jgi:monovalent cation:proton antiporter-2 (CPA2) family protein
MMYLDQFLLGAFVYLAAAVVAAPIATRLGLGSVLGYLVAGIVIGPSVAGFIGGSQGESVMHFAEFGVIVMLFLVGLELQPSKLFELRKPILGMGGLQVAGTATVIGVAAYLFGTDWKTALTIGLVLSLSSTAIVLQSLQERGLMKTSVGQSTFSVLLFQDISVIPMLALLPLLATQHADAAHGTSLIGGLPAWVQTLAVFAAVAAIILAGRYLMRPLFRIVANTGIREIFVAFALLIVVGITLLMQQVGLSAALGAFLAGVVLAESEYRHELEMDLDPFKGLLLAVFFIAVGAGIDFGLLAQRPAMVIGLVVAFIAIKLVVHFIIAKLFRMSTPDASRFSVMLAQGGEFAFVLISFVAGLQLLGADDAGLLVAVVAISMALAPLLILFDEKVIQPAFLRGGVLREPDLIDETDPEVIIAGFGRFGMTVGRLLLANGYRSIVLEHDAEQIDALRRFGFKLFYGDASRMDLLEAAGANSAKVLIVAVDGREKVNEIVDVAKKHFPHLKVFARAIDRVHAYELIEAGIAGIHREVFESSVLLAEDALVALGKHPYEAHRAAMIFKSHDREQLEIAVKHRNDEEALVDIARKGRAEISKVLATDQRGATVHGDNAWQSSERPDA